VKVGISYSLILRNFISVMVSYSGVVIPPMLIRKWSIDAHVEVHRLTTSFSWEPDQNLQGCKRLLQSFWQAVGTDDRDYPVGYVATPSKTWIGEAL